MIEIDREIDGAHDFELDQPRTSPLQYSITWPQEGEASGVVLVIPGFGGDTDSDYSRNLRRHIVETTGMGAVSVCYHAIEARPSNGGTLEVDEREIVYLIGLAARLGITVPQGAPFATVAKLVGEAAKDVRIRATIQPGKGERQNFGVMQALDHLCVIGDLMENAPPFDRRRIVALGSSHGGYIAHMIAKLAPSTLAAIIDNSSYCQPPMRYLNIGGDVEFAQSSGGVTLLANTKSAWTVSRREDPAFYSRDRDLIRDMHFLPHARVARAAAADAGVQYLMVNSKVDSISPPDVKQRQQQVLSRAGFDASLQMVGKEDIDGRLFKKLDHGLDCSLKGLFDREIGRVRRRGTDPDAMLGTVIDYDCVDSGYRFTHSATAPYVTGETYELYPLAKAGEKEEGRPRGRAA